jgi:hypothetical protein
VRYAVPAVPFYKLASLADGAPLAGVRAALAAVAGKPDSGSEAAEATRQLRLYACLVRASRVAAMHDVERRAEAQRMLGASFLATCTAVAGGLRGVLAGARALPDAVATAARWTDEDVSLVLETLCADLGLALERGAEDAGAAGALAEQLAAFAVKEARHRRARGYDSIGSADAGARQTEHFEFRRHVLRRFTASVLWLSLEVRQAATWVVHVLYALAAAAAMAFALAASVSSSRATVSFYRYALPIVLAYAAKDRIKALLQSVFSDFIAHRFPDRKWSIRDRERSLRVGAVRERAAFLPFARIPGEVLTIRRRTREHPLEEQARPERVLWHRKTVDVAPGRLGHRKPRAFATRRPHAVERGARARDGEERAPHHPRSGPAGCTSAFRARRPSPVALRPRPTPRRSRSSPARSGPVPGLAAAGWSEGPGG